jgi:hypothetical protein
LEKVSQKKSKRQRLYSTKIEEFPFSGYPLDNASPTTLAIHQLPPSCLLIHQESYGTSDDDQSFEQQDEEA